jgi:hypothetical protein
MEENREKGIGIIAHSQSATLIGKYIVWFRLVGMGGGR